MKSWFLGLMALCLPAITGRCELSNAVATPDILGGNYPSGPLTFVNSVVGWDTFFYNGFLGSGRVIANVEAGLVWGGHDVFDRPAGSPSAVSKTLVGTGALHELDFHATMVGNVLAGTGYVAGSDPANYYYIGLGMAPMAQIWTGAIATSYSTTQTGAFDTTTDSTVSVYRAFFQGIGGVKPDVINSSWGGADLQSPEMLAVEGLARQNPTVAFVAAAGNGGSEAVSAPGSTFNSIAVGSVGGANFLQPSSFSSRGPADFYNPVTHQTVSGVRAAVDIAAPGESFLLAAYLGPTGSLGASNSPNVHNPSPTDLYFVNESGTSFAAPIVAGGITLLKDAAENAWFYNLNGIAAADDTRVIKSVLMAGATRTTGWNNGQSVNSHGVVETTRALDYATGAGALNLDQAVTIYLLSGTRDLDGTGGGTISSAGWDFANVGGATQANDYFFDNPFQMPIELTISLNWFAGTSFDNSSGLGQDLHFSDLNLEVWQVLNGQFQTLLAESDSIYNNAEFLRVALGSGSYGIRVTFNGLVYETNSDSFSGEDYGLAWTTTATPEPSAPLMLVLIAGFYLVWRTRRVMARRFSRSGN